MTERIQHLLDEAVAGVRPRDPDPVPGLVRRAGRDRRRRWAAGGAAAAVFASVIAVGGFVAANRAEVQPLPAAPATPDLTVPAVLDASVAGGVVHAGGISVAVPPKWRVSDIARADYCDIQNRTILLGTTLIPGGDCDSHSQLVLSPWQPRGTRDDSTDVAFHDMDTWNEVILPGGQPLWLDRKNAGNVDAAEDLSFAASHLVLPWARMGINSEYHRADAGVFTGIVSDPVPPETLRLPGEFAAVTLTVKGKGRLRTSDPAVAARVLELLRGLDRPVQAAEFTCPSGRQLTPYWKLAGTDMAALTFVTAPVATTAPPKSKAEVAAGAANVAGLVAISTDDSCAFATSAMGGRVHLPAGFLAQLQQVLGGGR